MDNHDSIYIKSFLYHLCINPLFFAVGPIFIFFIFFKTKLVHFYFFEGSKIIYRSKLDKGGL